MCGKSFFGQTTWLPGCRVVARAISEMARTGYDYIVSEITFHLAQKTSADVVAKACCFLSRRDWPLRLQLCTRCCNRGGFGIESLSFYDVVATRDHG